MAIEAGRIGKIELTVSDDDTAIAMGSGSVPVLATPRLVALAEEATTRALDDVLGPNETTVGVQVQLDHVSPTPVGQLVTAEARLDRVAGRKLIFEIKAKDERGVIAAGTVTRVIVDRDRFLAKCQ